MLISNTGRVLHTDRLVLRTARQDDLAAFHAIMSDHGAMRYWSSLPHDTLDVTRDWMLSLLDSAADAVDWVMERDGVVIGKAGGYRLPEVGFILHPDYWGQGLMAEAMQVIIPELFAATDVPALIADLDPLNTGSLKLLLRLGFRETHRAAQTFCIGGVWSDSVYLSLPRPTLAPANSSG